MAVVLSVPNFKYRPVLGSLASISPSRMILHSARTRRVSQGPWRQGQASSRDPLLDSRIKALPDVGCERAVLRSSVDAIEVRIVLVLAREVPVLLAALVQLDPLAVQLFLDEELLRLLLGRAHCLHNVLKVVLVAIAEHGSESAEELDRIVLYDRIQKAQRERPAFESGEMDTPPLVGA